MAFNEARKERIHTLLTFITKHTNMRKKKLIGHFCFEWGLRTQKLEEYLAELESAGLIKLTVVTTSGPDDFGRGGDYQVKATKAGRDKTEELGSE